ncbi:MAG TPA: UDP-glucose/GDP-mannose dehydrogenase family protein [bacterium]|nr:UDP-glucose/GDP-mannose dehydrogenase family protein [bacterium]HOL48356.1 UDP-glucose/GDP-mannose dehydrogenase family protein [bacterium]HPQ18014.1 UDP-glucose/GDP-mannose dehydrogenase family protein [bacterium]
MYKISVVGTGYVGLVAGTCFAESGRTVICVDKDKNKIMKLKKGIIPIYEPGLEELVKKNIEKKRLIFTTELKEGVQNSDIIFIAVGTPPGEDGSADLRYVLEVAEGIRKYINGYKIVVNKSTVPVGTGAKVKAILSEQTKYKFDVVSNPEFLKEGAAIDDFMKPDRVVIGCESEEARKAMEYLYSPFVRTGAPILFMDIKSAEMTKYAANAMLATRISFMNEISRLCEAVGADVTMVRKGIGTDARIGKSFLFAGIGYGGSCFPKDVKALIRTAKENKIRLKIIEVVEQTNEEQKEIIVKKIIKRFGKNLKGKLFAVWGLSFKPNTDDMREAPSIVIINNLLKLGAKIIAYDPAAMNEAKKIFGKKIMYAKNNYNMLKNATALILVTEWQEFREPDFEIIKKKMKEPIIFDGRNILEPEIVKKFGFEYYCIGRPNKENRKE